jgi:hypothetical protein
MDVHTYSQSEEGGPMKILSMLSAALGVLAIAAAVYGALTGVKLLTITAAGYLRGAAPLLLLALVLVAYDQFYFGKKR